MRNALGVLALGGASWLWACAADPHITTATLELHELPSCELASRSPLTLRASGDFASLSQQPLPPDEAFRFDDFPPQTGFLAVEAGAAEQRAGGLLVLTGADTQRGLWMLPFGRSCPLGDPFAVASDGSVLAPLADGGLLIAGGRDARGAASASASVLAPGAALVTEVPGGMLLRRVAATATPVAEGVLVVGGAADDRGAAHDAFELYSSALGRFDKARSGNLASGPRRDHAAIALGGIAPAPGDGALDGIAPALRGGASTSATRVLVVGGVSELGAEPLRSAEIVDVTSGRAHVTEGELHSARVRPSLLALDSGGLLCALGNEGTELDSPLVREVERFDARHERFEPLAVRLPAHTSAAVVALEGDRVAYVGCDGADARCEIALLVPNDGGDFDLIALEFAADDLLDDPKGLRGLTQLRLLALHDGRVLVTGRAMSAPQRRGFIIDLNVPALETYTQLSRVPDVLLELSDGSRVEADAEGMSLAREDAQSVLDDAPKLIGPDATALALDDAGRWHLDDAGLTAQVPARADLPRLRFADARVEIVVTGEAGLLLEPDAAAPIEVALHDDRLALGDCTLARAKGDEIAVERHGDRIVLHSGKHTQTCESESLGERVGIALRAAAKTRFTRVAVQRQ